MSRFRIHKFGGSCLRDQKGLQRLTEIISAEEKPVLVTVSASYGITQYLIDVLESPVNQLNIPTIVAHLQRVHLDLLTSSDKSLPEFDEELRRLERLLYGITYTEEITPRTHDLILSFGERFVVHVVNNYFTERNMKSIIVDPTDLIRTNGIFKTSTILLEETEMICEEYIQNTQLDKTILIVPGYFGASQNKKINLLGRSGTDYTATALAYGFNAESIVIWKDVLGFMTADPNIIDDAVTLEELSYEEAAELSHFGAQILHSRSVIPAKLKKIPIFIRHLYENDVQTKIWNRESLRNEDIVKSVSYLQDLAMLRIYTTLGSNVDGVFNKISEKLVESNTNIISVATSQTCISVLIDKARISSSMNNLESLKPHIIDEIECDRDIALIGIVGIGLGDTPGIASRVFNSIAKIKVNVEMISSGASKAAYHFTVKQIDLKKALNIIHQEFF
ncbi:MAG: aspartate kinase [Candidatus Heimdallarchaeota archaeon]|nr:aspartate kinase [Candidatus Heimdallarchaeota archaeon]